MVEENENKEVDCWDRCLKVLHALLLYEFVGGIMQTWHLCQGLEESWRELGGNEEALMKVTGEEKRKDKNTEHKKKLSCWKTRDDTRFLKKVWPFD